MIKYDKLNCVVMISLNEKNRSGFLKNKVYVLKFSASWCGPCKLLAPIFSQVAESTDVPCASVDIDEPSTKDLVNKYQVKSVPTLIKVKNGVEVDRRQGFVNRAELTQFIN